MLVAFKLMPCALLVALAAPACESEPTPRGQTPARTAAPSDGTARAPTPASVVPGSHEDWCEEHQVPESMCTRCNPSLVAAFKATGDWCQEHGLPESFCPICHPERGGRPASDVSPDAAPADGTKVVFKTKDTARLAGIHTVKVAQRPSLSQITATARIVYDAAKLAEVNARSAGVVRDVRADIGTRVQAGTPLASIESATVGADRSRLAAARSRVRLAEANVARLQTLTQDGITARKDLLRAQQDLDEARAELSSVRAALGVVGDVSAAGSRYTLTSPIAGVVTQRNVTMGRLVDTEKVLFEIVDTSSMWAEIDIPEAAVHRLAVGSAVVVSVSGLGEAEFSGQLGFIAPAIDAHTRTAKGRVALDNPDGLLRGNMFARARISARGTASSVVVPRSAVQRAKDAQLVFVRVAEDAFEARRVQLGPGDESLIEVSGRLAPGEEVATDGSFLLKTETLRGSIGAGCCQVAEKH